MLYMLYHVVFANKKFTAIGVAVVAVKAYPAKYIVFMHVCQSFQISFGLIIIIYLSKTMQT